MARHACDSIRAPMPAVRCVRAAQGQSRGSNGAIYASGVQCGVPGCQRRLAQVHSTRFRHSRAVQRNGAVNRVHVYYMLVVSRLNLNLPYDSFAISDCFFTPSVKFLEIVALLVFFSQHSIIHFVKILSPMHEDISHI